jgi:hypothetical protein
VTMSPRVRKFALAAHLTVSVGWIGAVVAFLALVFVGRSTQDGQTLRAAWIAMESIGRLVLVPLSVASLLTGLVMALGTKWGLMRHYWVLISLVLTILATVVLVQHMETVSYFAGLAAGADSADVAALRGGLQGEIIHAGGGLVILLMVQVLNLYKPAGLTVYGWRKQQEQRRKGQEQRLKSQESREGVLES